MSLTPQQQFQAAIAPHTPPASESEPEPCSSSHCDPRSNLDLARAALCIGQPPDADVEAHLTRYLQRLDELAEQVRIRLPQERYPLRIIRVINQYLFGELGFRGNQADYYDPRNSFLGEVLDRRTGIPITLSLVYLEIARRVDFPMVGVGMPGHFVIRPQVAEMAVYVDPFHDGEVLFEQDCQQRLESLYQRQIQFHPALLPDVDDRQILRRMLTNLKLIYLRRNEFGNALNTMNWLLLLSPEDGRECRDRGLVLYELGRYDEAILDLQRYLASEPAENIEAIRKLLEQLRRF